MLLIYHPLQWRLLGPLVLVQVHARSIARDAVVVGGHARDAVYFFNLHLFVYRATLLSLRLLLLHVFFLFVACSFNDLGEDLGAEAADYVIIILIIQLLHHQWHRFHSSYSSMTSIVSTGWQQEWLFNVCHGAIMIILSFKIILIILWILHNSISWFTYFII